MSYESEREYCIKTYGADGEYIAEHWEKVRKRIRENPTIIQIPPPQENSLIPVLRQARDALQTATRFYAKKSKPPIPEYLSRASAAIDAALGEKLC